MQNSRNDKHFDYLSNKLLNDLWHSSPVDATILGIHKYDDTLGDISESAYLNYARKFKATIQALQSQVDPFQLDQDRKTDYHLAMALASGNYVELDCHRAWMKDPSTYPSIAIWGCFALLMRNFAPLEDRLRSMLSRMKEIPDMLNTSKGNIAEVPPVFVQLAFEVIDGGKEFFKETIPSLFEKIPSLHQEFILANDAVISSLEDYEKWLRETILPHANGNFAIGGDVYEQMLFGQHYLTYSPHDLVLLAKGILSETITEIKEVAASIDPTVSWQELIERLKLEHPPKDGLIAAYQKAMESARDFVIEHDLVTLAPGEELSLQGTPEFERSTMPYAAYVPPAPFGNNKTGCFWVTPINENASKELQESQLLGHCTYTLPIIALHEGYPGHHVQLTRAHTIGSDIRRATMSNLFIEGWALYCENMMYEQGFYTDPRVRLFQLKDMLWRVCRVIIDVGLHAEDMCFDDAVKMLVETACIEEVNAIAEVKRYTTSPTQPMTYVMGKLLLMDIKERVKRDLGNAFDLKKFHDDLLNYGSIHPPLIAERLVSQPKERLAVGM